MNCRLQCFCYAFIRQFRDRKSRTTINVYCQERSCLWIRYRKKKIRYTFFKSIHRIECAVSEDLLQKLWWLVSRSKSFLESFQHTSKEIQSTLSWGLSDLHLVTPWSRIKPHDIHSLTSVIPTFCVLFIRIRRLFENPEILPDVLTRSARSQVLTVMKRVVLPI
jgi:hypothetical protein